jgi:hypothetical protein
MLETKLNENEVLAELLEIRLEETRLMFQQSQLRQKLEVIQRRCEHWNVQVHAQMNPAPWDFWKECNTCGKKWDVDPAELTDREKRYMKTYEYNSRF